MTATADSKACTKCGLVKPFSAFSPRKETVDGYRYECKTCTSAARRAAYRLKNPLPEPKPPATEKACTKCGVVKALDEFHLAKSRKIGRVSRCKACCTDYQKTYNFIQSLVRSAPSEKCCPRCNVTKPASEFFPNAVRKDQLSVYCQSCQRIYMAEKQYDKKRYAEKRSEELARGAVYRAANTEKIRQRVSISRAIHRHKHVGRIRVKNVERKLRIKGATPSWANRKAMAAIYDEARRLEREDGRKRHVDHVIPLHGRNVCGLHVETNLRIVFARENLIKNNKFEVQ